MQSSNIFKKAYYQAKQVINADYLVDFFVGDLFSKVNLSNVEAIYPSDALDNGLSFTKMQKEMLSRHPFKVEGKDIKPYPIFATKTGAHLCCKKYRKSDI